jgi:hypothetical protein
MQTVTNTGLLSYISRKRNEVVKTSAKRKVCPKCNKEREFKFFGVRTHKATKPGGKLRFSPQSYCVDCRSTR